MRLIRIEFNGYKRLLETNCNVDGKLMAFVGPNEAGKSSVLNGLTWLSQDDGAPLADSALSRDWLVKDDEAVVKAEFALDDDDLEALAQLDLAVAPTKFAIYKRKDGALWRSGSPLAQWNPAPFELLATALAELKGEEIDDSVLLVDQLINLLRDARDRDWTNDEIIAASTLAVQLKALPEPAKQTGVNLEALVNRVKPGRVHKQALWRLYDRCPPFTLFSDDDRVLDSSYDLADEKVRSSPPAPLRNLLRIADTDVDSLWSVLNTRDISTRRTFLRRINDALRTRLHPAWRQAELTVELEPEGGTVVEVLLKELREDGAVTTISERSDGLRAFIALMAFLYSTTSKGAPILLIDEAETHLHLDAQADLIDVLLRQDVARQVLYTTHSPGCLPPDLGTGIRLVTPMEQYPDASELRNDFWQGSGVGFNPLLFKMGASAAAFSACRRAVLAEGAAEMILLPTLIRKATGDSTLLYQVAPGLSNIKASDPELFEVATKIAYLTDGDKGGQVLRKQLIEAGVPDTFILSLPRNKALEDLLTPECYLLVVNEHLRESGWTGHEMVQDDLAAKPLFGPAVKAWCETQAIKTVPGKAAIASRLVANPERIELQSDAAEALKQLHKELKALLDA